MFGHARVALERHFSPGTAWNRPRGGVFIWVTLPPGIDVGAPLERAISFRGMMD